MLNVYLHDMTRTKNIIYPNHYLRLRGEISSKSKFVNDLGHYKSKKKYVLIFTGGPTLTEFKKSDFSPEIYNDCYIIAVKNTINYLDSLKFRLFRGEQCL